MATTKKTSANSKAETKKTQSSRTEKASVEKQGGASSVTEKKTTKKTSSAAKTQSGAKSTKTSAKTAKKVSTKSTEESKATKAKAKAKARPARKAAEDAAAKKKAKANGEIVARTITPNDRKIAAKGQTKEEQQKKKSEFNAFRVEWFDEYMRGIMPSVYEMRISTQRGDLLSDDEQKQLAAFIQAGIAGKLLRNAVSEKMGDEGIHLQKTIIGDRDEVVEMLEQIGYTVNKYVRSKHERRKLDHLIEQAEDARNLFAEKNLGLVTMIASRRKKMSNTAASVDIDDLIAEGMNGLMIAIDHYNPATGNKFSTPAAWWIEQPIRNYLDSKTKTIHMPTHMNNIYKSIYFAARALRDIYPDDAYITDEKIAEYCQGTGRDITVEKIKEARELRRETVSYDAQISEGDSGNKSMIELIASEDDMSENVLKKLGGFDEFNRILALIDDDRKRELMRDWYSSKDICDAVILSNVSRKHCITKEKARNWKSEAEAELNKKISQMARDKGVSLGDAVMADDDEYVEREAFAGALF